MAKMGYVKEFDLDAPSLPRDERSSFRYQTRSLTSLYERCLPGKVRAGGAWKILVEVVPFPEFLRHRNLLGVLVIQIAGDPQDLFRLDADLEKGNIALDWLQRGLEKLASEIHIGGANFADAADVVRSLDFVNRQKWIGPRKSPDGRLSADVIVDHAVHEAIVIGRVFDTGGSILSERVLTKAKPDEFNFAPLFGSLSWINEQVVELRSKDRASSWSFEA